MKRHISYFYNALLEYYPVHQAWCKTWSASSTEKSKLTVTQYVENVQHWQKHKHANVLAISQLRHQSVTAPKRASRAADAVAAHQCYESDSDVIFTLEVK